MATGIETVKERGGEGPARSSLYLVIKEVSFDNLRSKVENIGMPNIPLSDDQYKKLTIVAKAAGYEDVPAFIGALANEPSPDPRGPLSEKELLESAAMIERGNAEIEAGGGMDAEEAFRKIAEKHGLSFSP